MGAAGPRRDISGASTIGTPFVTGSPGSQTNQCPSSSSGSAQDIQEKTIKKFPTSPVNKKYDFHAWKT
ncbi:MAG: hypothetical protein ACTSXK_00570 [Promethearchaeota archaeon]